MRCPTDGAELVMAERQGVEIDYCPTCRGIWLDRGELDKIIDRAGEQSSPIAASGARETAGYGFGYEPPVGARPSGYGHNDDDRYQDGRSGSGHHGDRRDPRTDPGRRKRRGSWLGDLLDFD